MEKVDAKKMNILVIGEHYSDNLGDGIISDCFTSVLRQHNISYTLLDISGRTHVNSNHDLSTKGNFNAIRMIKDFLLDIDLIRTANNILNSIKLIKYYKSKMTENYDLAMYDGGSIFMDYFAPKVFIINRLLYDRSIEIWFNACGMGKISNSLNRYMLNKSICMQNVRGISLRDSCDLFERTFERSGIETRDIGLIASNVYGLKKNNKNYVIGIGCIDLSEQFNSNYYNSLKNLIILFEKKQLHWELFSNGGNKDSIMMLDFYENLRLEGLTKFGSISTIPQNTNELVSIILKYSRIITCRLHSAIIAYSYQIPAFVVDWSEKISYFYMTINHPEYLLDSIFDADEVIDNLLAAKYGEFDLETLNRLQKEAQNNILDILGIRNKM